MLSSLLLTTVACLTITADPAAAELAVGDAAPKLETKEFVKGEPVKEFTKGKTYVVEFWATWCGPCKESIPHLTELQKKFKDVAFMGVSVDEDTDQVKPFVDKMGDKMDYRVAIDARDGKEGRMSKSWLEASGQEGIPTAYVINGEGKVAWIGHPSDMEEPLKQIAGGKWDLVAKAAEYKKSREEKAFARTAQARIDKAIKDKDYAGALKVYDAIATTGADAKAEIGLARLSLMVLMHKDADATIALAKEQVKENDPESAVLVLSAILNPMETLKADSEAKAGNPDKLEPAVAKYAAEQADKIDAMLKSESDAKSSQKPADKSSGDDESSGDAENGFQIADTKALLARAYEAAGNKEKAGEKLDDGIKALNATVRAARDGIKELKEMKKALNGEATADKEKATDEPASKPIVQRKKKVEP